MFCVCAFLFLFQGKQIIGAVAAGAAGGAVVALIGRGSGNNDDHASDKDSAVVR